MAVRDAGVFKRLRDGCRQLGAGGLNEEKTDEQADEQPPPPEKGGWGEFSAFRTSAPACPEQSLEPALPPFAQGGQRDTRTPEAARFSLPHAG